MPVDDRVLPLHAADFETAYRDHNRAVRHRFAVVGGLLALIMVPLGVVLDYFVFRQDWPVFLLARVTCDLLLAPCVAALFTPWGRRHVRGLSLLLMGLPALTIDWLIWYQDGITSPYYVGVLLIIVVGCKLPLFTLGEAVGFCLVNLAIYLAVCAAPRDATPLDAKWLVNNVFFLVAIASICVTVVHFDNQRRRSEFELQYQLSQRNEQLSQLDHLKSQFFANLSHELRTPLTLILSPLDQLLQRPAPLEPGIAQSLLLVRQNAHRLLALIDDLLDLVRLEEGRLHLRRQPLELISFVQEIVETFRPLAHSRGLQLKCSGPAADARVWVDADFDRMQRVLFNLLNNAVKFSARQGSAEGGERIAAQDGLAPQSGLTALASGTETARGIIEVMVSSDGDEAVLTIQDDGPGIASRDLPRIFERFYQAQEGRLSHQGLGLGLALVREIVEAHGGHVRASSGGGGGATFEVRLAQGHARLPDEAQRVGGQAPRAAVLERALVATPWPREGCAEPPATSESGSKLLVVDDEDDMRRLLVSILSSKHVVHYCSSGIRAVALAGELDPDVVVLDVMLPDIDGLEVARRIRSGSSLADTKILMLTARSDEGTRIAGLRNGADDFLNKPFGAVELSTRLDNLLKTNHYQRRLRLKNHQLLETIATLNETRSQLVQSEKMNSLGSLAAGLLHEINNPLNYVKLAVSTLMRDLRGAEEDLRETLTDVEAGLDRINDIIASLREFAYPEQAGQFRSFVLQDALRLALRFTAHILDGVTVVYDPEPPVRVTGEITQISQVFVNLLTNAHHAICDMGPGHAGAISVGWWEENGRWVVRVHDNGPGIPPQHLSRVLDPFFTTREVGQGVGLGLSVAHTIIKNHGGQLRVENLVRGASFTFDLPQDSLGVPIHDRVG